MRLSARESELKETAERLEQRVAAIGAREISVARHAASLAAQAREAAPVPSTPEPEPIAAIEPEPAPPAAPPAPPPVAEAPPPEPAPTAPVEIPPYTPPPPPVAVPAAAIGLTDLERLVAERGHQFPDRLEEWNSYLFFLRDHADVDGSLPASFADLIGDVFAPLL
jgi:hypothetical protein